MNPIICSLGLCLCFVLLSLGRPAPLLSESRDDWQQAIAPRVWQFPRDNGAHREYRTEWWYFTGNLVDPEGNRYGYELTFFREGIRRELPDGSDPWSLRDIYLAHFAISDVAGSRFTFDDRISRTGPGLAGAGRDGVDVWIRDWSVKAKKDGTFALKARTASAELSLDLVPVRPPVINGKGGVSKKGDKPGQASYYVSYPRIETTGYMRPPGGTGRIMVRGLSWFDHEFGSNQLTPDQAGWDWFSLHLSDGRDLMLYLIRRVDGSVEPASSGTIVEASGSYRHLTLTEVKLEVLDHWRSSKSGATYPGRWRITIPSAAVDLTIRPLLKDQELLTPHSTGITYWEGAVEGQGFSGGRSLTCEGYVELTGYAGRLGGLF